MVTRILIKTLEKISKRFTHDDIRTLTPISIGASTTMALWAVCYPLITISIPYAPIMLTAFFRAASAGAFLILVALFLKRPIPSKIKDWAYICAVGITATSTGFWGMFYAGSLISPGLATVITNTQPIIAGLLGWYFLSERMNKLSSIGTTLGFIGIAVISINGLTTWEKPFITGIFYILIAATGIAISNVLLKKMANGIDVLYAMGFQLLIGSIPLGIIGVTQDSLQSVNWHWHYVLTLATLAIPGTAMPFILWYWLMNKAPLYQLNVYSFLTPIFGLTFGFVFFSEVLTLNQWLGVTLVIIAITLVSMANKKHQNAIGKTATNTEEV